MIVAGDEAAVGLTAGTREKDAGDEGSVTENEGGLRPSGSTRKVRNYKGSFTLSESERKSESFPLIFVTVQCEH